MNFRIRIKIHLQEIYKILHEIFMIDIVKIIQIVLL